MMLIEKALTKIELLIGRFEADWETSSDRKRLLKYVGIYTIVFTITFLVTYSPLLRARVSLIWTDDGRNQFFPMLFYLHHYIRQLAHQWLTGNYTIPLYDISFGVGDSMIAFPASTGYFDPFYLLGIALVPLKYGEHLLYFMSVFHVYLAGLAFSYMCRYFQKSARYSLLGSMIYCFNGYALVVTIINPIWLNALVTLPLLIVGTEELLRKRSPLPLVFSVMWTLLCAGFYFLYMSSMIIGIYASVRLWVTSRGRSLKSVFLLLIKGSFAYILGLCLCGVIFFPSVAAFLESGRRGFSTFQGLYPVKYYFNTLMHLIAPPGSFDYMAFAAITLPALLILFMSSKEKTLKILIVIAFAVYMLSFLGQLMNGLQYPSNRWIYALTLAVAYAVVEMLPDLESANNRQKTACLLLLTLYLATVLLCGIGKGVPRYMEIGVAFLSLTLMVLVTDSSVLNDQWLASKPNIKRHGRYTLLFTILIANIGLCGMFTLGKDKSPGVLRHLSPLGTESRVAANLPEREAAVYLGSVQEGRIDSRSFSVNKGMMWGLPTMLPSYNTLLNRNVCEHWLMMEGEEGHRFFSILSTDQRTIQNTLLSQLYHMEPVGKEAYVPYGYSLAGRTSSGKKLFRNDYPLPWGYTYDKAVAYESIKDMNGLEKQELMLQAVVLENVKAEGQEAGIKFDAKRLTYEPRYENCSWVEEKLEVKKNDAKLTLLSDIPSGVELYVRLRQFDISEDCSRRFGDSINKHDLSPAGGFRFTAKSDSVIKASFAAPAQWDYYFGRVNYLFNLGYSAKERRSATLTFPRPGTYKLKDIELYALPMTNYPARVNTLRAEPLKNIQWGTNKLSGSVDLSKDKILCLSVPYSKGWSATVDGQEAEILRGNYMFMALPLKAGHHVIVFSYCTPGLKLGAVLTVLSWAVFLTMLVRGRRARAKEKKVEPA